MIKLIKGNCLEVMKQIESGSVDAIITDPPYGTTACKWDSIIPFNLMWEQLNRIIKPNGAIVLFGSEPFSSALRMSNIKNYKYDWIWNKKSGTDFLNAKRRPLKAAENVLVFYKKQPIYNPQMIIREKIRDRSGENKPKEINNQTLGSYNWNKKGIESKEKYPINIISISNQSKECNNINRIHPTQKPLELMEYLIKTYTNEGETVLDFTMGSGSTMVACQNLNRNGIGIEQDEKYFEIAEQRIKQNEYKLF